MKYAFVIARVLLGLVFTVFGLNAFLHFFPNPPVPGLAAQFMGALLGSHYYVIAFGTELIGGALLLSNRYVPFALTVLGPVIVNILSFHMFLDSENMAPAIVVTVLWFVVFSQMRSSFAGLFVAKTAEVGASSRTEALAGA
jgi:putative oxidoreductase